MGVRLGCEDDGANERTFRMRVADSLGRDGVLIGEKVPCALRAGGVGEEDGVDGYLSCNVGSSHF